MLQAGSQTSKTATLGQCTRPEGIRYIATWSISVSKMSITKDHGTSMISSLTVMATNFFWWFFGKGSSWSVLRQNARHSFPCQAAYASPKMPCIHVCYRTRTSCTCTNVPSSSQGSGPSCQWLLLLFGQGQSPQATLDRCLLLPSAPMCSFSEAWYFPHFLVSFTLAVRSKTLFCIWIYNVQFREKIDFCSVKTRFWDIKQKHVCHKAIQLHTYILYFNPCQKIPAESIIVLSIKDLNPLILVYYVHIYWNNSNSQPTRTCINHLLR